MRKKCIVSCVLLLCLFSGMVQGCSKKPAVDPLTGEEPGAWYDYCSYELGTQYDRSEYSFLGQELLGTCKDKAVVCVTYQRHLPQGFDYMTDDYSQYQGEKFDLYDLTGQLFASYTFDEIRERSGIPDNEYFYGDMGSVFISDDYIFFKTDFHGMRSDGCACYRMDPDTGIAEKIYSCEDESLFTPGCGVADGYFFILKGTYRDFSRLKIDVVSPSGEEGTIDVGSAFPNLEWNTFSGVYNIGNGRILIPYYDEGSCVYYCADLAGMTVSPYEEDLDWFTQYSDIYFLTEAKGFGPCITDDEGLKRVDFDGRTSEYVFNFDRCNANQVELAFSKLFMADEDTYVFGNSIWVNNNFDSYDMPVLIVLQKSITDPTAGRDMIRLAPLYGMHYAMAEAVRQFNETNTEAYIIVDQSYTVNRFQGEDSGYIYVYGDYSGDPSEVSMTNKLMIDLMAGDGPDMIMGGISFSQFCTPEILADMSDQIGDNNVFGNVIDACRTDGALYNVPLSFSLSGICTLRSNVREGQLGFTFDEYDEFVRGVCNGNNPIKKEKTEFFLLCLGLMNSEFINENGRLDYDCDAFRQLAEYVNDNVTYREPAEEEMEEDDSWRLETIDEETAAFYGTFTNLSEYVGRFSFEATETAMLGVPAVTPVGPSIAYADSVAVTAGSRHRDECGEFVRLLLSEDIQDLYVKFSASTPVNVDSYESSAGDIIDIYNRNREDCINSGLTTYDLIGMGMGQPIEGDAIIYDYEDYIRSATAVAQTDPAIAAIVREEIPAYFEGQKSLEEVIAVISDRIDTYQNESR